MFLKIRNLLIVFTLLIGLMILGYKQIAYWAADFLISTDPLQKTEYAAVLSGDAKTRAKLAAKLYNEGKIDKVLCPGRVLHFVSTVMDTQIIEPEFTRLALMHWGVPDSNIIILRFGTSTKEEADTLINYCKNEQIKDLMVITSEIHTRRVRYVYEDYFKERGIEVNYQGAPHPAYNADNWYRSEAGLININNEWIKYLLYLYLY